MFFTGGIVYKVMKNVGNITASRMVKPLEPQHHPLVSDDLFEGRVRRKGKVKKLLKQDVSDPDLPMNKTPEASKMTTNSPRRTTPKSTQVGGPYDVQEKKDDNWIQGAEADIKRRGTEGKCTPITKPGCTGRAKALAKTFKKMAKKRDDSIKAKNEAKDSNWIQGAEADIKRRGTEGKCTPITKPGCTGRAKALAKTFKKMAKKRDDSIVSKDERKKKVDEGSGGQSSLRRKLDAITKQRAQNQDATWDTDDTKRAAAWKKEDELRKQSNQTATRLGRKKGEGDVRSLSRDVSDLKKRVRAGEFS